MAKQQDETNDSRLFYRISSRAFARQPGNVILEGESLMLALLLHAKGKRTKDQTDFVKGLMNDPNQRGKKNR